MRIGHFDTGRVWRGGQRQVLLLMRGLSERGHESVLFAPDAPLAERARAAGFTVVRWRPWIDLDPPAALAAATAARRHELAILHAHDARAHASAALAGAIAGRPVVVSRRVPLPVARNPLSALKYAHGVTRYLCVSHAVWDALRRSGIPEARLAWVPSAFEPASRAAPPVDVRALIGAPPAAPIAGTVGSLSVEKDHRTLLEAAPAILERVPDLHFVWIGDGAMRESLERRRAELGLERRVHLPGFREDAAAMMAELTVLVHPSRFEGLGNTVLEAAAAGVPVIATAVGGVPELIEDGVSGRLVPPGDPPALARAVIEALEDPERRRRWAEQARLVPPRFTIARTAELTLAEYARALEERR